MDVSVGEAASRLGVSPRRIRARLEAGDLRGRQVGKIWVLDEAQLGQSARSSRPMSARVAWAFLDLLVGGAAGGVSQPERSRLRRKQELIKASGDKAPDLLRAWLPGRAARIPLSVSPSDVDALKADERLALSGLSDPRSGMSAAGFVEAYVAELDLPAVRAEFLLSAAGKPNVVLHVLKDRPPVISPAAVIADLADHDGPREDAAAMALLRSLQWW